MKVIRTQVVEETAEARLNELAVILGKPITPPVPIELLAERVFNLAILWEPIDELPGEVIFGGIRPKDRLIVLNERRRSLFERKPGLVRSTMGHELGHWDLFVDKGTLDHPVFTGFEDEGPFCRRSAPAGEVAVLRVLQETPEGRKLLAGIEARADDPSEASAVNRFAAALSMPRALISKEALALDRTRWPNLYVLANRFDVTISALTVRLEQLNLLYVRDKELFESRDQALGQGLLF